MSSAQARRRAITRQLTASAGAAAAVPDAPPPAPAANAGAVLAEAVMRAAGARAAPALPSASPSAATSLQETAGARRAAAASPPRAPSHDEAFAVEGGREVQSSLDATLDDADVEADEDYSAQLLRDMGFTPDDLELDEAADGSGDPMSYAVEPDQEIDADGTTGDVNDLSPEELEEFARLQQLPDDDEILAGSVALEADVAPARTTPPPVTEDDEPTLSAARLDDVVEDVTAAPPGDDLNALVGRIDLVAARRRVDAPAPAAGETAARAAPAASPVITLGDTGSGRRPQSAPPPPTAVPVPADVRSETAAETAAESAVVSAPSVPATGADGAAGSSATDGQGGDLTAALTARLDAHPSDTLTLDLDALYGLGMARRTRPRDTINRVLLVWLARATIPGWNLRWDGDGKLLVCDRAPEEMAGAEDENATALDEAAGGGSDDSQTMVMAAAGDVAPHDGHLMLTLSALDALPSPRVRFDPGSVAPEATGTHPLQQPVATVPADAAGDAPVASLPPPIGSDSLSADSIAAIVEDVVQRLLAVTPRETAASTTGGEAADRKIESLTGEVHRLAGLVERLAMGGAAGPHQQAGAAVQSHLPRMPDADWPAADWPDAPPDRDLKATEEDDLPSAELDEIPPSVLYRRGDRVAPALLVLGAGSALMIAMPIATWTTALLTPIAAALVYLLSRRDDTGMLSSGLAVSTVLALLYAAERARAEHLDATLAAIARALGGS